MKKFLTFLSLTVSSIVSFSQILHVPQEYQTIQAAINAAVEGDTILVDEGTYVENIEINKNSIIVGSRFLTTGDTSYISSTIIDGNQNGSVVIFKPGGSFNAELAGFTITNGNASGGSGGGIFIAGTTPVLHHLKVVSNTAASGGGIACLNLSVLNLSHSLVSNNTASNRGAGIQCFTSTLDIRNCLISENKLQGGQGGAIYFGVGPGPEQMPNAYIDSTIIAYNTGSGMGATAGAYFEKPDALPALNITIKNSQFVGNKCIGNTALRIHGQQMEFNIVNAAFLSNEAIQYGGGAIFTGGCSGNVINCLFASNKAATGGGEYNSGAVTVWGSEANFYNCTFIGNSAFYGAAMTLGAGDALLENCIFRDNADNQIALVDINQNGSSLDVNYSNIQDGQGSVSVMPLSTLTWGEGNIDADPLFLDDGDHPYNLDTGSPCIDAGNPGTINLPFMPTDFLGNNRIWDGDADGTAVIDMGPYEYGSVVVNLKETISNDYKALEILVYPNPSYTSTTIEYQLAEPAKVTFTVCDHLGRKVYESEQNQTQGIQKIIWTDKSLPAGMYYLTLQAGEQVASGKIVMMK